MKRLSLIALMTAIMVMAGAVLSFAEGGLELVASYPQDGQKNTSMENLGVKLIFNKPINSKEAQAADKSKFKLTDEDGETVPIDVLFSEKNDGLVLVLSDPDKNYTPKNNSEYTLTIDAGLVDNEGNTLNEAKSISFKTYNQKINTMVSMLMMLVMMGGIMFMTMKQNTKTEEEEPKAESKEAAFNPYKEAKRTGKSVEEIQAAQAKKEAKAAKKKARKKDEGEAAQEKKIDNCAQYLNNVYHVHAPAPTNKADRSIEAIKASRKGASKAKKKK